MIGTLTSLAVLLSVVLNSYSTTLTTNTYRVRASTVGPQFSDPLGGSAYGFTRVDLLDDEGITEYLSSMAVSFPVGANVGYDKVGEQLCAQNTEENLRLIEWIVNRLNGTRWQPYFDWLMVHFAMRQQSILRECEEAKTSTEMARSAYILRALWGENLLSEETKDALVDRYYRLVLSQRPDAYPVFEVRPEFSFPFPDTYTDFTPTLYINGKVVEASHTPMTSRAMSVQGDNHDPVASRSGGEVRNGDVVYYKIELQQRTENPETRAWDRVVWVKTIRTNEIVLQGLKSSD